MRVLVPGFLSLVWVFILSTHVSARRTLSLSSLVTCMENSQLQAQQFEVEFNLDNRALHYNLNMNSEINGNILADVIVYAYGFKIIERTVNMCDIGWKQFCPLYSGVIDIDSIEYISPSLVSQLPNIAFTVPDIDAVARIIVRDYNGTELACIQASFSNGRTVSHVAAKWVTAVVAGVGLLASALLSAFGNSNSASHISSNAVSLFLYFQSVVIVSMCHVQEMPPIAAAWAENLSWSMGLIRITFMQDIFRWYVQSTGGTPALNFKNDTVAILVQRSFNFFKRAIGMQYVEDILTKRDSPLYGLEGSNRLLIFRGMERVAYKAHIEITSVCCTGFTFFVLCAYVVLGVFLLFYSSLLFLVRLGWIRPNTLLDFRRNWKSIMKGVLQRYIYIGYTQLMILSMWQFIERDSAAVIVLLCIFLVFSLSIMAWSCFRTLQFGRQSVKLHQNPALILYGDQRVLNKYGWFYTMFRLQRYWWGAVLLAHTTVKLIFIAFAQSSGKTQAFALFIVDLLYCCWLIYERPYLDRPTNVINILISVVVWLNSFLFTFFSNLYGQPAAVASIMGWVFFILNAAFTVILLILILVYALIALFSKNPDARFHPAKDDRTSFQNKNAMQFDENDKYIPHHNSDDELFALGLTAKDHNENWAGEMYKLKDNMGSDDASSSSKTADAGDEADESFGAKLVGKITRGKSLNKSLLRRNKQKNVATTKSVESASESLDDEFNTTTVNNERETSPFAPPLPTTAFHSRTDSNTPMMQQQNIFSSPDDVQTMTTTGMSNYDVDINNSSNNNNNTHDFNFRNLSMGRNGNTPQLQQPQEFEDLGDSMVDLANDEEFKNNSTAPKKSKFGFFQK